PREAFVLGCGDDDTVFDQCGGAVVIGGVDPERVHGGFALRGAGGSARSTTAPNTKNRAPVRCRWRACAAPGLVDVTPAPTVRRGASEERPAPGAARVSRASGRGGRATRFPAGAEPVQLFPRLGILDREP